MSLAGNIYRELTGYDDPDDYAPPLIACIVVALCCWVPWVRVLRVLGFMILIWVVVVLILI